MPERVIVLADGAQFPLAAMAGRGWKAIISTRSLPFGISQYTKVVRFGCFEKYLAKNNNLGKALSDLLFTLVL